MFAPNLIIEEIWQTLNSNATLQGSTYLTTTGRIWQWRRPEKVGNPLLTVQGSRAVGQTQAERWNLIVTAYANDLENETPDSSRLGRIIGEVSDTLHLEVGSAPVITITGGRINSIYEVSNTGVLFDEGRPKEHLQSVFLTAFAIKNNS